MQTELWTFKDYQSGNCDLSMVNMPKPEQSEDSPPVEINQQSLAEMASERGISLRDAEEAALLMLEKDAETFARRNPTIFLDLQRVQRLAKAAQLEQQQSLGQLSARKLYALPGGDTWFRVIAGVQKHVSADCFQRILAEWGIDPEELVEMIEAGELLDDD
jgi:hypothetical protein